MDRAFVSALQHKASPFAIILGANEIASAVAVQLCRTGWSTVLIHDPLLPVVRRAMSFHDALFDDRAMVEEIRGERADTAREIAGIVDRPKRVAITWLGLADLLAFGSPLILVDARLHKDHVTPSLRYLASIAVGLGQNFSVGSNCDIAVEIEHERRDAAIEANQTRATDGRSRLHGSAGLERTVYSDRMGRWRTPNRDRRPGLQRSHARPSRRTAVCSPGDGVVRGIVRDGLDVPADVELLEIDRYARRASWSGIDQRNCRIAEATVKAIKLKVLELVASTVSRTTLQDRKVLLTPRTRAGDVPSSE
jgi:xanthine dehydrogenase accessory factor